MTKVDFYLVDEPGEPALLRFACRLTQKIFSLGHQIHIHAESGRQARQLDELLWSFSDLSFLPHRLVTTTSSNRQEPSATGTSGDERRTITIGFDHDPVNAEDVLINLSDRVPLWFSRFNRVTEFVGGDEPSRGFARERYRFYRDRGYNLDTHQIAKQPE